MATIIHCHYDNLDEEMAYAIEGLADKLGAEIDGDAAGLRGFVVERDGKELDFSAYEDEWGDAKANARYQMTP